MAVENRMEGGRFLAADILWSKQPASRRPLTRSKGGRPVYNILSNSGVPLGIVSPRPPSSLVNRVGSDETSALYEFTATASQGAPRRQF